MPGDICIYYVGLIAVVIMLYFLIVNVILTRRN
jgi:hypothetical protein